MATLYERQREERKKQNDAINEAEANTSSSGSSSSNVDTSKPSSVVFKRENDTITKQTFQDGKVVDETVVQTKDTSTSNRKTTSQLAEEEQIMRRTEQLKDKGYTGSIDGKVYEGLTEQEILQNKLSPETKSVYVPEGTARRTEAVEIQRKIKGGEPLTQKEQFRVLTGESATDVKALNRAIGKTEKQPDAYRERLEGIEKYNKDSKEYQESKGVSESIVFNTTEKRTGISSYAERLVRKEAELYQRDRETRFSLGQEYLDKNEYDNWAVKTLKSVGNIIYVGTAGVVTGTTGSYILLAGEKAGLLFRATGEALVNPSTKATLKEERKNLAYGFFEPITAIKVRKLVEEGKIEYDPKGTANLLTAGLLAGVTTAVTLELKYTTPPKTTGKITSKTIELKGETKSVGNVKGTRVADPSSKSSYKITYSEKEAGVFGRNIKTTVTKSDTGLITKTQQAGKYTYESFGRLENSGGVLNVYKSGNLVKTSPLKSPFRPGELTQYEQFVTLKSNQATQVTDSMVYQSAKSTGVRLLKGKVSETQKAGGQIRTDVRAETVTSVRGETIIVRSGTKGGKLTLKELELSKTNLKVDGKGQPANSITTVNEAGQVTATFPARTDTVFNYVTKFEGSLKVSDLPIEAKLFIEGQRGSLGADPSLITRTEIKVAEISIPGNKISIKPPFVEAGGVSNYPSLIPVPITTNLNTGLIRIQEPATALTTEQIQIQEPTTSLDTGLIRIQEPTTTLKTGKIQIQEPTTTLKTEQIQIQEPTTTLKTGKIQIQESLPDLKILKVSPVPPPPIFIGGGVGINLNFDKDKTKQLKGYRVITKKGGKEKLLSQTAFTKEEALQFGANRVGKTARASFKLVEAKGVTGKFKGTGGLDKFYKSKSGFFVEKNKFRIDTPGEVREISRKGLKAKKQKKSKSLFKGVF